MKNVTALLLKLYPKVNLQDTNPVLLPQIEFVGSIRRGLPDVHDVDLLAPLPRGDEPDDLYARLAALYGDPKADAKRALFAPTPENEKSGGVWGRVAKGLAPGFKMMQIVLPLPGSSPEQNKPEGWSAPFDLKIEIHRYTPGPQGNKGWIQMIRTGPGAGKDGEIGWGEMMLIRWKQRHEGAKSQDGWPVYRDGTRHPVPTELEAFKACGFDEVIPPHARTLVWAKQLANARQYA